MATNQFLNLFGPDSHRTAPSTVTMTLKFYFHPDLVPDLNFAKAVLPKYVSDMNYILAKNTTRQFSFNPNTGITLTTTQPYTGSGGTMPATGYEVWANVIKTDAGQTTSNSGFFSLDVSGAAVLAGMKWLQLYDRDVLATNTAQLQDYWTQVYIMLHEFGHVLTVAIGEYYNLISITDNTGVAPVLNINFFDPNDSFWADKPDWSADPMLRIVYGQTGFGTTPRSYQLVMSLTRYSNLSAAIISGGYRTLSASVPPTVDLQNITVKIINNATQAPIPGAIIKIWSVNDNDVATLMIDTTADGTGTLIFAWGGGADPHNSSDFLRLIKVYATGYTAKAKYVSIWDTDISKLLYSLNIHTVTIGL